MVREAAAATCADRRPLDAPTRRAAPRPSRSPRPSPLHPTPRRSTKTTHHRAQPPRQTRPTSPTPRPRRRKAAATRAPHHAAAPDAARARQPCVTCRAAARVRRRREPDDVGDRRYGRPVESALEALIDIYVICRLVTIVSRLFFQPDARQLRLRISDAWADFAQRSIARIVIVVGASHARDRRELRPQRCRSRRAAESRRALRAPDDLGADSSAACRSPRGSARAAGDDRRSR